MDLLPPEPAQAPPPPVSAYRRVIAAYERIAKLDQANLWRQLRSEEDVLVEAKAVDVRARCGETLPLAGTVVAVGGAVDVVEASATAMTRLVRAGAVVLGATDESAAAVSTEVVDAAVGTGGVPSVCHGIVAVRPTRGLVPVSGLLPAAGRAREVAVFAGTLVAAQRVLAEVTGPDETDAGSRWWPDAVRFGAGERPRVAVPEEARVSAPERAAFRSVVDGLRASGAEVIVTGDPAGIVPGQDAVLVPAGLSMKTAMPGGSVLVPLGDRFAVRVLTAEFEDQIGLDLAALLTGEPERSPYPATGTEVVMFGEQVRGRPGNAVLAALGARFTGPVWTAERYRMVLPPGIPPEPGVRPDRNGTSIGGERWLLSPSGFARFTEGLPAPVSLGPVELVSGETVTGVRCDAGEARDITEFGDWRGYLRYVSVFRSAAGFLAGPASG